MALKKDEYIIDLRNEDNLDKKTKLRLKKICNENINEFAKLINKVSINLTNNIDWWVSSPSNRNNLTSDLYLRYCKTKLIYEINKRKKIDKIIVDTNNFKKVLIQIIGNKKIIVKKRNFLFTRLFFFLKFIFLQLVRRLLQLIACRMSKTKDMNYHKRKLTLIDTYVLPGFYSKDRYYNGMWEKLNLKEKKSIFFISSITYTKIRNGFNLIGNIYNVYLELRKSKRPFIIKEDYIYISDVLYAVLFSIRSKFIKIPNIIYKEINYKPLIIDDLNNLNNHTLSIEGILNYRFIKNINDKSLKINLFIDWWENQAVDKGFHMALNKYYPKSDVKGYLGYVPRNFEMQLYPTEFEIKSGVVPKKIVVIGKSVIKIVKKLYSNLNVKIAPAFRYNYLWESSRRKSDKSFYNIVIALPINYDDSIIIIKKILNIKFLKSQDFRLFIKPHPTMNTYQIKRSLNISNFNNIYFTNKETKIMIKTSNLLISSMSIVALESISLGTPVILIERESILDFNPIPDEIDKRLWHKCLSTTEIKNSILFFKNHANLNNHKNMIKISYNVKKNFFSKINHNNVLNFLNIKR